MIVWVLILYAYGGPTVVDNIASRQNCEALAAQLATLHYVGHPPMRGRCIAVRKVAP